MATNDFELPVSVKCIVLEKGKVWLRHNERGEWELPGGKLDKGEQPQQTAEREALEELGIRVSVGQPIGTTLYTINLPEGGTRDVFVVTFICNFIERVGDVEHIGEAGRAKFQAFEPTQVKDLPMPDFYKQWIKARLKLAD